VSCPRPNPIGISAYCPAMSAPTLRERLRYKFDNLMSRGTPALIGLLAAASAVLVVVFGTVSILFADDDVRQEGLGRTLWMSLMRALDPGAVAGDEANGAFLFLMLLVTIGGLFIVAALVGVLSAGLDARLDELRKGRSRVVEQGHTVLLGWSDQIFTMLAELVAANESESRSCVAILAERDKVEMEDELRARVGNTGRTRIVCRTGNPADPVDLELVNLDEAKSVIVLSPETEDAEDADALVVKTLLALSNRTWAGTQPPVVTSVAHARNLSAARLAGGRQAVVVDADDITARLVVQTSRQAGLSVVFSDLLDFAGDEIYMHSDRRLTGATFGDALHAYETATVIGMRHGDGRVVLNPPMDTLVRPSDEMVVIAEDDSVIRLATTAPQVAAGALAVRTPLPAPAERLLLLGWNVRAVSIVEQLDQYVAAGSQLLVAAYNPDVHRELNALQGRLRRLHLGLKEADITDRVALEALDVGTFDHVIVLAEPAATAELADSRTLVTLLQLRDMEATLGQRYSIVSEMNDERNRQLAQVTKADDFVVGGRLISLLLTQLAENHHLASVFANLFDPHGSEIYLKPADEYVRLGGWINFATVIEAARRRGETAIGYRVLAEAQEPPDYGIKLNPPKDAPLALDMGDRVIVLAED
jgi:ion channel POLLUX/CASTOR